MCPQYTDALALGTTIKLRKPCQINPSLWASVYFGHISSLHRIQK